MGAGTSHDVTTEDKRVVLDTWKDMRMERGEFSTSLFIEMIFDHPKFASYWPFVNISDNAFGRFTAQFIREFDAIIMAINNPNQVSKLLQKNAKFHVKMNIPADEYNHLQKCILIQIEQRLSNDSNKTTIMRAWSNSITECFATIMELMEKARKPK